MNRSVSLTLTADDYVAANRLHLLGYLRKRTALVNYTMLVLAYFVWVAAAYLGQWGAMGWLAFNACFAAVPVCIIASYFLSIPITTRKTYRDHKTIHRPYTYSWSETGLAVASANGEWNLAWSDYLKWDENAQVFILYQAPRLFNILPKRALTAEQIVDIRQCAGHIAA
jgi:hypothetical protein